MKADSAGYGLAALVVGIAADEQALAAHGSKTKTYHFFQGLAGIAVAFGSGGEVIADFGLAPVLGHEADIAEVPGGGAVPDAEYVEAARLPVVSKIEQGGVGIGQDPYGLQPVGKRSLEADTVAVEQPEKVCRISRFVGAQAEAGRMERSAGQHEGTSTASVPVVAGRELHGSALAR